MLHALAVHGLAGCRSPTVVQFCCAWPWQGREDPLHAWSLFCAKTSLTGAMQIVNLEFTPAEFEQHVIGCQQDWRQSLLVEVGQHALPLGPWLQQQGICTDDQGRTTSFRPSRFAQEAGPDASPSWSSPSSHSPARCGFARVLYSAARNGSLTLASPCHLYLCPYSVPYSAAKAACCMVLPCCSCLSSNALFHPLSVSAAVVGSQSSLNLHLTGDYNILTALHCLSFDCSAAAIYCGTLPQQQHCKS